MDSVPAVDTVDTLTYDEDAPTMDDVVVADTTPFPLDEEVALPATDPGVPQLVDRIGTTKVYLLSEATGTRVGKSVMVVAVGHGKRKHDTADDGDMEDKEGDVEMNEDSQYRENAILFRGTPISHLPTSNIFAYATHFDAHPIALEWIDDKTCVLVFPSKAVARQAHRHLAKSLAEEPSEDDSITAKPIPVALWPPEERINKSLGKGEGVKGTIRMRWARIDDVKQKGAKNKSEFYKKYGMDAGKEGFSSGRSEERDEGGPHKRRRRSQVDDAAHKARLDDDLDAFLAEDEDLTRPSSPPSKMRSDRMGEGRTLLERTSAMRARPDALESRIMAPLPRRARSRRGEREEGTVDADRRSQGRRPPRPRKTQRDLDDELDAFLRERD